MSRKFMIACAALASIAAATLASSVTDAEAARGGAFARSHGAVRAIHHAPRGGFHAIRRAHRIGIHRHHLRPVRHVHRPIWRHRHSWCWRHPWHCRARYVSWRPYVYAAAAPAVVATAYAAPTVSRCTCLTKEYLPDGSALFRDLCTKEEALMPNPNLRTSEAPPVEPQAPLK